MEDESSLEAMIPPENLRTSSRCLAAGSLGGDGGGEGGNSAERCFGSLVGDGDKIIASIGVLGVGGGFGGRDGEFVKLCAGVLC